MESLPYISKIPCSLLQGSSNADIVESRIVPAPLVVVALISVSGITAEESGAKGLVEKRCSLCHPSSRPLGKTKSSEEWEKTVLRLEGYAGDRISDKDAKIIAGYLSEGRGK
jgi:cytochrome c5